MGDRSIRLWDAETGELQMAFEGHRGGVQSIALSPDGNRIASTSTDRTIRMWNTQSGEQLEIYEPNTRY